ncbi:zf-C3HC-domain-containing protein [Auriscalpium vulgare]|uniref:Zf-C3HC-domain-containing protein n=1 Tax=Auriscalpium vulgare TaxID=40419 RepID=A0ACB8RGX5_9AGAM|nr:zf-C3HC-domain-containing protein [Auriscalpium vulgare]
MTTPATPTPAQITASTSTSSNRSNKRKFEDALQSLDDAVGPRKSEDAGERPDPPKRQNTVRSLYSTLAKYGIRSKEPPPTYPGSKPADLSKAPHLAAIIARTATKTRKAIPRFRSATPAASAPSEYRPSSTASFLARLATYKLNTYANKPPSIDAVAAAKAGWVNDGKDRLVCGLCSAAWVVVGREGMGRDAANALVEKQRGQLASMHKNGCPWKTRQCDPDVYRISLSSPAAMGKEIKLRALTLESVLEGVDVKHPLNSTQVQNLLATIASIKFDEPVFDDAEPPSPTTDSPSTPSPQPIPSNEPSPTAVLTSLFGWSIAPAVPPQVLRTPSLSRAVSAVPSIPGTPRASSTFDRDVEMLPPESPLSRVNSRLATSRSGSAIPELRRDSTLLHCSLCHRRLGLWAVGSVSRANSVAPDGASAPPQSRQIDLLREHRPYCPYVVRSTTVPSLPVPPTHARAASSTPTLPSMFSGSNASLPQLGGSAQLEGWRAVLMVVLRYRMGARQRDELLRRAEGGLQRSATFETLDESEEMEVDPVEAMVAGVKSKGGRELLKYVKGLLG